MQKAATLREEPAAYHAAWSDGERLLLAYEALLTNLEGVVLERRERMVEIPLAALMATPEIAVDVFPVRHVGGVAAPGPADRAVSLISRTSGASPAATGDDTAPFVLLVDPRAGPTGRLDLLATETYAAASVPIDPTPSGVELRPLGRLHGDALVRAHTAWWAWPLAPLAAAADLVILPFQLATVWPIVLLGY